MQTILFLRNRIQNVSHLPPGTSIQRSSVRLELTILVSRVREKFLLKDKNLKVTRRRGLDIYLRTTTGSIRHIIPVTNRE